LGRKRSDYICPKCGQQGRNPRSKKFKHGEYLYVEHYDPVNKKILRTCYIENILRQKKLKEIWEDPSPETKLIKYAREKEFIKISNDFSKFAQLIKRSDITPEDEIMLAGWIRQARIELWMIFMTIPFIHMLRKKENRTQEEEQSLKRAKKFIHKFNTIVKQTSKTISIVSLLEGEKTIVFTPAESKIIQKNLLGFAQFSNLSIIRAFSYWFDKYERPRREARFVALKEKYSDGAFGSEKYPATMGY
jgi:hypothetical protein